MDEWNIAVVMVVGFAGMIFGFISVIGTMVGLFIWLDRKHSARMDRIDKRIDDLQEEMRGGLNDVREEMRSELNDVREEMRGGLNDVREEMRGELNDVREGMRELRREMRVLNSKVDRAQGALDVLVFGERGVPPPVARERAETERQVEEPVGD